jgi:DNA polymerase-3 subunit epsilon
MPPDVLATAGALVVAALVAVATALLWPQAPQALAAAAVAVVAVAWLFVSVLAARFAAIERVRDGVVVLAATGGPVPAAWTADPSGPEGRLAAAVAELAALERARAGRDAAASARRLEAVVAGLDAGVLAVAPNGLIALANGAAAAALGERVRVGTSVFDAIHRHAVLAASAAARAAGRPVPVSLDPVGGGTPIEARVGPLPDGDGIATPLADLAAIALDTETTGLDPRRDRVLSVGAVRMHGVRVFRADTLDLLVDPGVPIPPASSRIHGLTDQTVAGAPPIAAVLDRIADVCRNRVVVGHNIGFDLAILAAEAARSGHRWSPPPTLDTLALAAALDPVRADLDLDALAPAYGIVPAGRHTALGDALLTADLFVRFLPLLAERGVTTLGAARALAAAQTKVRRAQAEAGW